MGERFSRGKKIKKLVEKEKEERNKIGEESKFVGRRVFSLEKKEKKKREEESLCVRRAFFFSFISFLSTAKSTEDVPWVSRKLNRRN